MPASLKEIGARNIFQNFQNAIMLAPVAENLLELGAIVSMLNYSKTFLPVHIKDQLPVLRFLWRMMRDLARAKSHSGPPIKSANDLCFKLSSKRCLNCNLETQVYLD